MVGPNISDYKGWIQSLKSGLHEIPTYGWQVARDSRWITDTTLKFHFIKNTFGGKNIFFTAI